MHRLQYKDEQCLRSDSGSATSNWPAGRHALGLVERRAMRAARFRNAAGGCVLRMGAAFGEGGGARDKNGTDDRQGR